MQYSLGFSNSIYEEIADENWSYACKGLFDRQNRRKQIFVALSSFLQHIPKGLFIAFGVLLYLVAVGTVKLSAKSLKK